jgi:phosphoribosylamine-glycine ligase
MKKIILLAGGHDQISLIEELRSIYQGVEIILIDYFDNPPSKKYSDRHIKVSTLDKALVLKIAKEEKAELVITACTDQAILTMAYVSEKLGLKCYLSYEQAMNVTNKFYMKSLMKKAGIPTARYIVVNYPNEFFANKITYPIVVKPSDNNGSKGIFKVFSEEELKLAITEAFNFSRGKKVIIEEFKTGEEFSIDAFLFNGHPKIIIATRYRKIRSNEHGFTILQSFYPCIFSSVVENKIYRIIKQIGIAFKLDNTPLFLQILVDNDEINVIEFSARTGGGSKLHFIRDLTGVNIIQNLLDITFGRTPCLNIKKVALYAAMNFIYTKPGVFCGISNIEELKTKKIVHDYYYYKTTGMEILSSQYSADRPAGFFVLANTEQELKDKILFIDQNIKVLNENNEDIMLHGLYST